MIRTIIIEDEFFGQELLKRYITENFPGLEVVAVAESVLDAVKSIHEQKPQLVLLDIQIKGGTGFDVLASLKQRDFEVIFITAFSQHAIQAIKQDACDYILKPIKADEFKAGIQKALNKISDKQNNVEPDKRISINTSIGIDYVPVEEIQFFEADGAYTTVVCDNRKILSSKNIGEFEKMLDKNRFFRTHHSFIINVQKVKRFEKGRSGKLIMENSSEIPVSQRKIKDFSFFLENKA